MRGRNVLKIGIGAGLLIVVAIAGPQSFQNTDSNANISSGGALERLFKEVNDLKIEVLQLRIEAEQARLEMLERELRRSEEDLQELAAEENGLRQEVEDLQRQLLDVTLTPEQRAEIAITTSEALTTGAARLSDERAAVEQRRSMLRVRLAQVNQTVSQLLARAAALGLGPASQVVR